MTADTSGTRRRAPGAVARVMELLVALVCAACATGVPAGPPSPTGAPPSRTAAAAPATPTPSGSVPITTPTPAGPATATPAPGGWSAVDDSAMPPMSDLNAVACASDTECWAVGSLLGPADALFEEYTGGSWTAVYSADGSGAGFGLQGITCLPSGDCWAVGAGPGPGAAIEYYDGSGWTAVSSPPSGAGGDQLNGIACVSSEDCWAVGFSGVADDANKEPLIEHYAAGVWTDVSGASTVAQDTLAAVSCATSTDCWAVGTSYVASGDQGPAVIEHYDGSAWTLVTGAPVGAPGELSGVTCSTSTECWAVGVSYVGGSSAPTGAPFIAPVIDHYDGSSWTLVASPTADSAFLADVTCPSPADCWAVGEDIQILTGGTLIEHYTGSDWSVVVSPSLTPVSSGDEILGIACPSTTECWAAGTINYTGFPEEAFIDAGVTPG